ncbi:hypothetical protein GA0115254_103515 [Streptomyces sp. Ncost-T10-10d]|nr:hypothetical protein GA0115254_103515 [Streptomyces sp. Ncost-T10-10d]
MLAKESVLAYVEPGVTVHGIGIGRCLQKQRQRTTRAGPMGGQRERLEQLGVVRLPPEQKAHEGIQERLGGVRAGPWQPWKRTGHVRGSVTVPRGHVETLGDGTDVRLGVFLSNTKSRRAKLTTDKLTALANLALEWAA